MVDVHIWDTVAANNTLTPPDGAPENILPSTLNNIQREYMAAVRRLQLDTNGSILSTGAANTYVLSTSGTYASLFDGLNLAFEAHQTNTGAATLGVNALTAVALHSNDGPLMGGEIRAGGKYRVVYDGTVFRIDAGFPTELAVSSAGVQVTGTGLVDLVDDDTVFSVRGTTASRLEFDTDEIQAKANVTTAGTLDINRFGGTVFVGAINGVGADAVTLQRSRTLVRGAEQNALGVRRFANPPPAVGAVQDAVIQWENSLGVAVGRAGFINSADLRVRATNQGGALALNANALGGVQRELFHGDPDGIARMGFQGDPRIRTKNESATEAITSADVAQPFGVAFLDAAPAVFTAKSVAGSFTLNADHASRVTVLTGTLTVTFPSSGVPLFSWGILVNDSTATQTLTAGAGVTLDSSFGFGAVSLAPRRAALWWQGRDSSRFWISLFS